ncbi:MAG: aminotransferase class IV [Parachlamydia sp.]|nr:aminotransferase class IV [Parachlamydia sp.]
MIAYFNGKFIPEEEAKVPISDRGLLYGDGLFTTLRVAEGKPERLKLHLERLKAQCQILNIRLPEIFEADIAELIRANNAGNGIWRLKILVTGGDSSSLHLPAREPGAFAMLLKPYVEEESLATLCLYPEPISRPLSHFKTLAYLDRLWVKEYALRNGFKDAIVTSPEGHWLECAFSNLFWRVGDRLFTPRLDQELFAGITLSLVLEAAQRLGLKVEQVQAKSKDIPVKAQVYQCNSLMGIRPIVCVESQNYPRDEEFERKLQARMT